MGEGFFDGMGVAGEVEGACGSRDAFGSVGGALGVFGGADVGQGLDDGSEFRVGNADASDGFVLKLGDLRPIEVFGERDELLAAGEVELFPGAAQEFPVDGRLAVEGGLEKVLDGVVSEEGFESLLVGFGFEGREIDSAVEFFTEAVGEGFVEFG